MTREMTFVLDVGKSNIKANLFDADGGMHLERAVRNSVLPAPPYPHVDVAALWAFCLASLTEAGRQQTIDAIVVTTHGATGALIGETDLELPILDYEFTGVEAIESSYAMLRAPFHDTFSPPLPGGLNLGRQLAWQSLRFEEQFLKARRLLMYPQYWTWRMTGAALLEATSLGAHTDLWQPRLAAPSSLARALGVTGLLPPMARAYDVAGKLRDNLVAQCGLSSAPDVLVGIHDSNASILPHLASRTPPFTVVSTGTWVIIFGLGLPYDSLDPKRDQLANIDVEGRPIACARFMGGREYAAIMGDVEATPTMEAARGLMQDEVFALPSFVQGTGPFPMRPGHIEGAVDTPEGRATLATLYTVLMTDYCLDQLGARQGDLIIEGSFAGNPVYSTLLAALRPAQPVFVSRGAAGASRGAAMLANWPAARVLDGDLARAAQGPFAAEFRAYRNAWRYRAEKV